MIKLTTKVLLSIEDDIFPREETETAGSGGTGRFVSLHHRVNILTESEARSSFFNLYQPFFPQVPRIVI